MESVTTTAPPPLINGQGTAEAQWQAWPQLHGLPEISLDRLVPAGIRAVVVAPHPDDEVLASGGMLAMLAARGDPLLVVGVTDGDASHPGSARWTPEQLAAFRHAEALAGLAQLGIKPQSYLRLSLPDGRVRSHHALLVGCCAQATWCCRPGQPTGIRTTRRLPWPWPKPAAPRIAGICSRRSGCGIGPHPGTTGCRGRNYAGCA